MEQQEKEALIRMFDTQGWKIFEEHLNELAECNRVRLDLKRPVADLSRLNFDIGMTEGIESALLLILGLKEDVQPATAEEVA